VLEDVKVAVPFVDAAHLDGDVAGLHLALTVGSGGHCHTIGYVVWFSTLALVAGIEASFGIDRIARHRETEEPEHRRREDIAGRRDGRSGPVRIGKVELDDAEQ